MIWISALMLALPPTDMVDGCDNPYQRYDIVPGGIPVERLCTLRGWDAVYISHAYSIIQSYSDRFEIQNYFIETVEWDAVYQVRFFLDRTIHIDCERRQGSLVELILEYPDETLRSNEAVTDHRVGLEVTISEVNNRRGQSRYNCPVHYESSPHPLLSRESEAAQPD